MKIAKYSLSMFERNGLGIGKNQIVIHHESELWDDEDIENFCRVFKADLMRLLRDYDEHNRG